MPSSKLSSPEMKTHEAVNPFLTIEKEEPLVPSKG